MYAPEGYSRLVLRWSGQTQIKLLRILSIMGAGDRSASENMYAVIDEAMNKANTGHTIGNAIIFECVRTITAIYPNPGLLESGTDSESSLCVLFVACYSLTVGQCFIRHRHPD